MEPEIRFEGKRPGKDYGLSKGIYFVLRPSRPHNDSIHDKQLCALGCGRTMWRFAIPDVIGLPSAQAESCAVTQLDIEVTT